MKIDTALKKIKEKIIQNDVEGVEELLVKQKLFDQYKLIFWAVEYFRPAIVKMLINNGFSPSSMNPDSKSTLLHVAARKGASIADSEEGRFLMEIIRFLVDQHIDINMRDIIGKTPLMYSVSKQLPCISGEITIILIEAEAKLDLVDDTFGWTALHFACDGRNKEAIEALLVGGANFEIEDFSGKRAVDIACDEIKNYLIELGIKS